MRVSACQDVSMQLTWVQAAELFWVQLQVRFVGLAGSVGEVSMQTQVSWNAGVIMQIVYHDLQQHHGDVWSGEFGMSNPRIPTPASCKMLAV